MSVFPIYKSMSHWQMLASALIIQLGDSKIGRRSELIAASILFTVGTIIQSSATTFDIELLGENILANVYFVTILVLNVYREKYFWSGYRNGDACCSIVYCRNITLRHKREIGWLKCLAYIFTTC